MMEATSLWEKSAVPSVLMISRTCKCEEMGYIFWKTQKSISLRKKNIMQGWWAVVSTRSLTANHAHSTLLWVSRVEFLIRLFFQERKREKDVEESNIIIGTEKCKLFPINLWTIMIMSFLGFLLLGLLILLISWFGIMYYQRWDFLKRTGINLSLQERIFGSQERARNESV